MADTMTIGLETPQIDSGCSLEKELIELIYMNSEMILSENFTQVDSCHGYIRGPFT